MSLTVGDRLGQFELLASIGEGGMGTVFRARDTNLGREVAIKLVRQLESASPDSLARLKREACLLAALNHPNVATLYDADEADGLRYLVLELVAGTTLEEAMASRRFEPAEALRTAAQIASALDAAHQSGIVHRDLKPANVKLAPGGVVKVLDFGLATLLLPAADSASGAALPTITREQTREGTILGTPAYMSPEQARGFPVDRRADIWSFGCVLFELLTGVRAFARPTITDTLSAVLAAEPPWDALPERLSPRLRRLLRRCLEKEPERRLRDIGDALHEIEDLLAPRTEESDAISLAAANRSRRLMPAILVGVSMAIGAGLFAWLGSGRGQSDEAPAPPEARFLVPLAEGSQLRGTDYPALAISPRGGEIVYVGSRGPGTQLYHRPLASLHVAPLAGTEQATSPFFSPSGSWVAFFAHGKLKKVPVAGGPVETICEATAGFGGSWGSAGEIVFAPASSSGLWSVSEMGGTPRPVSELDAAAGEFSHRWPALLPGGRVVLYAVGSSGSWDEATIVAAPLDGGARTVLVRGGSAPAYLPSGHLLFVRRGALMAMPFDAARLEPRGAAQPVIEDLRVSSDGAGQYAVAPNGALVHVNAAAGSRLTWVDRHGGAEPLAAPAGRYADPRLSPDGRQLALSREADETNIWIYELERQSFTQLTFEGRNWAPLWTRDGSRVVFTSNRTGSPSLYWRAVAANAVEELLVAGGRPQAALSWLGASGELVFANQAPETGRDLGALSVDGERQARVLLNGSANESGAAVSPDGRWLAYVSDESGRSEVVLAPADAPVNGTRISEEGGAEPVWSKDGRELYFRSRDRLVAVTVAAGLPSGSWSQTVLFQGIFEKGVGGRPNYDVATDRSRFLFVRGAGGQDEGDALHVSLGWLAELERRVPSPH